MTVEHDSLTRLTNKILIVDDHPFIIQGYKNGITRYQPESTSFIFWKPKIVSSII
jgi:hypothetical protein